MRIFLDTDVILDFLQSRTDLKNMEELFHMAEGKKLSLVTSPLVLSNVFYIVSKEIGKLQARKKIAILTQLISTVELGQKEVINALNANILDFEDGLQYFAAIRAGAVWIVTRNKKDFPSGQIQILSPKEAVILMRAPVLVG